MGCVYFWLLTCAHPIRCRCSLSQPSPLTEWRTFSMHNSRILLNFVLFGSMEIWNRFEHSSIVFVCRASHFSYWVELIAEKAFIRTSKAWSVTKIPSAILHNHCNGSPQKSGFVDVSRIRLGSVPEEYNFNNGSFQNMQRPSHDSRSYEAVSYLGQRIRTLSFKWNYIQFRGQICVFSHFKPFCIFRWKVNEFSILTT